MYNDVQAASDLDRGVDLDYTVLTRPGSWLGPGFAARAGRRGCGAIRRSAMLHSITR